MIRRIALLLLHLRAWVIEQDIYTREELHEDLERRQHAARKGIAICHDELRRVRNRIATLTPAPTLLAQALRRKALGK